MDNPKYIVYEDAAYIFPVFVDHSEFARRNMFDKNGIDGAGFVCHGINGPACYGKSVSLGVASREEEDTKCIQKLFRLGDYLYS